jgi:hypothetical protein
MNRLITNPWEIAAGLAGIALLGAGVYWFTHRKRPTADEVERDRRLLLVQAGRIVDGMLLDPYEIDIDSGAEGGRRLRMLLFSYRIGGVDYECSQDISALSGIVDVTQIRAGFPCSVRYQPGNPQNSIVVAENWSGMRTRLTVLPLSGRQERTAPRAIRAEAGEPQPHL